MATLLRKATARRWLIAAAAFLALGVGAAPAQAEVWSLNNEFKVSPNQANPNPDHSARPDVWQFLHGNSAPYSSLSAFVLNGTRNEWHIDPGTLTPQVWFDTSSNSLCIHPGSNENAVIGWKSPITGTVSIDGGWSDVDSSTGNGIVWSIDKNGTNIASGSFANGGSQTFANGTGGGSLASVSVATGDFIYFIVGPGAGGDSNADSTCGSITITSSTVSSVTMRSLGVSRSTSGVLVRWRTASEVDILGFNVYRQVNGRRVRVNARLIRAHGAGEYSVLDRSAPRRRAARYWIQAVNLDGSRRWYGPTRVASASGR